VLQLFQLYKPHFKTILHLSWPIIIGQLGIVMMGVADTVMIGKIDATNLAAAGLANAIYYLITILGLGTLTAVSPLIAKAKAEGNVAECINFFKASILVALVLSVFIFAVNAILSSNLHWFKQQEKVIPLAKEFLQLLNYSTLPFLLYLAVKQFSDGLSITAPSAVITILALLLNIILNYIFIYGNWGFQAMGLKGAGYATLIARTLMFISMLAYVLLHKQYKPYLIKTTDAVKNQFRAILKVGLPSGFQYFFEVGAFATAAIIIGWIGKNEQAAHTLAINLASLTYMVATGFSAATGIAVGDAYGRKNKLDMLFAGKAGIILGGLFMGFCAIIFTVFNQFIVELTVNDVEVQVLTAGLLYIAAMFQLSDGVQAVSLGALRGLADTKVPTIIAIVAYWVIGIPLGYYFTFTLNLGLYGIWYGLSIGLTFSAVFLCVRFVREVKVLSI
jgi:multidrug resistance protein, MATE family